MATSESEQIGYTIPDIDTTSYNYTVSEEQRKLEAKKAELERNLELKKLLAAQQARILRASPVRRTSARTIQSTAKRKYSQDVGFSDIYTANAILQDLGLQAQNKVEQAAEKEYQEALSAKPVYKEDYEGYVNALNAWSSQYGEALGRGEARYSKTQDLFASFPTELEGYNTQEYNKAVSKMPSSKGKTSDQYVSAVQKWAESNKTVLGRNADKANALIEQTFKDYQQGKEQEVKQIQQQISGFSKYKAASEAQSQRLYDKAPSYHTVYLQGTGNIRLPYYPAGTTYKELVKTASGYEIVTRKVENVDFRERNVIRKEKVISREKINVSDPELINYIEQGSQFSYMTSFGDEIAAKQKAQIIDKVNLEREATLAKTQIVDWNKQLGFVKTTKGSEALGIAPFLMGQYKQDAAGKLQLTPIAKDYDSLFNIGQTKSAERIGAATGYTQESVVKASDFLLSAGENPVNVINTIMSGNLQKGLDKYKPKPMEEEKPVFTVDAANIILGKGQSKAPFADQLRAEEQERQYLSLLSWGADIDKKYYDQEGKLVDKWFIPNVIEHRAYNKDVTAYNQAVKDYDKLWFPLENKPNIKAAKATPVKNLERGYIQELGNFLTSGANITQNNVEAASDLFYKTKYTTSFWEHQGTQTAVSMKQGYFPTEKEAEYLSSQMLSNELGNMLDRFREAEYKKDIAKFAIITLATAGAGEFIVPALSKIPFAGKIISSTTAGNILKWGYGASVGIRSAGIISDFSQGKLQTAGLKTVDLSSEALGFVAGASWLKATKGNPFKETAGKISKWEMFHKYTDPNFKWSNPLENPEYRYYQSKLVIQDDGLIYQDYGKAGIKRTFKPSKYWYDLPFEDQAFKDIRTTELQTQFIDKAFDPLGVQSRAVYKDFTSPTVEGYTTKGAGLSSRGFKSVYEPLSAGEKRLLNIYSKDFDIMKQILSTGVQSKLSYKKPVIISTGQPETPLTSFGVEQPLSDSTIKKVQSTAGDINRILEIKPFSQTRTIISSGTKAKTSSTSILTPASSMTKSTIIPPIMDISISSTSKTKTKKPTVPPITDVYTGSKTQSKQKQSTIPILDIFQDQKKKSQTITKTMIRLKPAITQDYITVQESKQREDYLQYTKSLLDQAQQTARVQAADSLGIQDYNYFVPLVPIGGFLRTTPNPTPPPPLEVPPATIGSFRLPSGRSSGRRRQRPLLKSMREFGTLDLLGRKKKRQPIVKPKKKKQKKRLNAMSFL